ARATTDLYTGGHYCCLRSSTTEPARVRHALGDAGHSTALAHLGGMNVALVCPENAAEPLDEIAETLALQDHVDNSLGHHRDYVGEIDGVRAGPAETSFLAAGCGVGHAEAVECAAGRLVADHAA